MTTLDSALIAFCRCHGLPPSRRAIVCSPAFASQTGGARMFCGWPLVVDGLHRWYGPAAEQFHLRALR